MRWVASLWCTVARHVETSPLSKASLPQPSTLLNLCQTFGRHSQAALIWIQTGRWQLCVAAIAWLSIIAVFAFSLRRCWRPRKWAPNHCPYMLSGMGSHGKFIICAHEGLLYTGLRFLPQGLFMQSPVQQSGAAGSSARPSSAPATAIKTETGRPVSNGSARHLLPAPDPVVSLCCSEGCCEACPWPTG